MTIDPYITYEFGPFRFDRRTLLLSRDGRAIHLSPKASQLLLLLLEARGEMVSKDELISALWPRTFVEEGNLPFQIHDLRKALGDRKGETIYIETIPRRGYRFLGTVIRKRHDERTEAPPPVATITTLSPAIVSTERPGAVIGGERSGRWGSLPLLAIAGLAIAFVGLYLTTSHATPAPRVMRSVQLTHDGRMKGPLLPYDASHIVVTIGGRSSKLLDVNSGRLVAAPVPDDYLIVDVSQSRREALAVRPADRGAECALWVVPLNGAAPRRLGSVCSSEAAWSPDGRQIAYAWMTGLYVTSPDGFVVNTLATFSGGPSHPRWSPDGRTIRFQVGIPADRMTTSRIWEIHADGTGLHRVESTGATDISDQVGYWMRDDTDFVFQSNRDGHERLWMLHQDSRVFGEPASRLTKLTNGPLDFLMPLPSTSDDRLYAVGRPAVAQAYRFDVRSNALQPYRRPFSALWVDYAPDGTQIAYVSEPDHGLWIANADGSAPRRLRIAPVTDVDACAWSPDGKTIVFRGAEPGRHHKIYLIPRDGDRPVPLTASDVEQGIANWSPDGTRLTFGDVPERFGRPTGSEAIHLYDLATGADETVPGSRGLWTSRWSPDGRYLAALTIQGQQLMLFDWHDRTWRATNLDHVDNPTWSRDGRYIYFAPEAAVDRPVSRLRVADGAVEGLVSLKGPVEQWSGITPDNSVVVLSADWDVYALELGRP
jgi:DNA-binding winged helix-turn-helix (wHTH) protein/Tol biopolymer transport system component